MAIRCRCKQHLAVIHDEALGVMHGFDHRARGHRCTGVGVELAAFAAGGADYVTKPIRPAEVLARIAAHVTNARQMRQARSALDAFGQATVAVRAADSRIVWQTPLARSLLNAYFANPEAVAPEELLQWIAAAHAARSDGRDPAPLLVAEGNKRLLASFHA